MSQTNYDSAVNQAKELLDRYAFELKGYTAKEIVEKWLLVYNALWLRLAVVEALYQGRYKAISVEQILDIWLKKGNPVFHFNHEFECLICSKLPQYLTDSAKYVPQKQAYSSKFSQKSPYRPKQTFKSIADRLTPQNLYRTKDKLLNEKSTSQQNTVPIISSPQVEKSDRQKVEVKRPDVSSTSGLESPSESRLNETKNRDRDNTSTDPKLEIGHSIDEFTPSPDASSFYSKLKAVAHNDRSSDREQMVTPEASATPNSSS